ncbi:MAG: hypothetical protein IT235_03785 [Bacteroidia bacterium]|nr:hypothetical protein [Bacteroidia bacterium]
MFKIRNEDEGGTVPIPGAAVAMYDRASGKLIDTKTAPGNGNVTFVLDLDKSFSFTFTKKEFVTKKLLVDAGVVGKENKSRLYYYVEFIVNMYTVNSSKLGAELLDKPFDRLVFDPKQNQFDSDKGYLASIKSELAKLSPQEKANRLNRLKGNNSSDDMEEQYKESIAQGNKALSSANYNKAKEAYTKALGFKPGDKYAQDKLKQIAVAMKPRTPADAKYNDLIEKADASFNAKQYDQAKSAYKEAGKIKPTEKYPKDKIVQIEQLVGTDNAKRYKDALFKADKFFVDRDYAKAKEAYNEAAAISPNEKYPKDRIKEIEAKYNAVINQGEKAFKSKDYTAAKDAYEDAAAIRPNEKQPKERLIEIDKLIKETQKKLGDIDHLVDRSTSIPNNEIDNIQIAQQLQAMRDEQQLKLNQMKLLKKAHAKHMANLGTKYTTINPLTRLMDIVDTKDSVNTNSTKK